LRVTYLQLIFSASKKRKMGDLLQDGEWENAQEIKNLDRWNAPHCVVAGNPFRGKKQRKRQGRALVFRREPVAFFAMRPAPHSSPGSA
jgi:hypothetical protein